MNSDTPRTDAQRRLADACDQTGLVGMAAHAEQLERELAAAKAEVERLREALTEIIKYAKGVHDPHLEELTRDFLKEMK